MLRIMLLLLAAVVGAQCAELRFAILGDRTGGANDRVYERIAEEVMREHLAFAINVGDTIEGLHDERAEAEWRAWRELTRRFEGLPLYFTPGNHDIWNYGSERLYERETRHPPQYSVTIADRIHITVLDNSRTEALGAEQLEFLERDLRVAPPGLPRLVFFHRPFWILPLSFGSGAFELHRIAKQYGVAAVVSGHGHQFVRLERDGVQYLEAGSSGGSLARGLSAGLGAKDGWFYGWTLCTVRGSTVTFEWRKVSASFEWRKVSATPPSRDPSK